jgi:hypothetical protein
VVKGEAIETELQVIGSDLFSNRSASLEINNLGRVSVSKERVDPPTNTKLTEVEFKWLFNSQRSPPFTMVADIRLGELVSVFLALLCD